MSPTSHAGAERLLVLAHGLTDDLQHARFGGTAELSRPEPPAPPAEVGSWSCGPEPACRQTVALLGADPTVVSALAGPDFGAWTGRTLTDVAADDPTAVARWARDPGVVPPGGESLTDLVRRLRGWTDAPRAPGRTGVVVTPLVARALLAAALGTDPELVLGIDVTPGGQAVLSRSGARWRLQRLG